MKIRWLVLLGLVLVGLLMVGCDDRSPDTADDQPEVTATEPPGSVEEPAADAASTEEESAPADEVGEQASETEIIAYANGRAVSREEYESALSAVLNQYAMTYSQFGMDFTAMLQGGDGRLRQLSMEAEALYRAFGVALVEAEAEERGVLPSDEAVEQAFAEQLAEILDAQGMTEESLATYMEDQGSTLEEFKSLGRKAVAWRLALDAVIDELTGPIDLSDDELQSYLDEHIEDYSTPAQVNASHILFATTDMHLTEHIAEHEEEYLVDGELPALEDVRTEILEAIRAEADDALAKLRAGGSFEELAESQSMGPDAGNLGWFSESQFGAPFDLATFALNTGEISEVIESIYGYHIIRLEDRREAFTPELGDVADEIRAVMEEDIRSESLDSFMADAYEEADFEILLPLLGAVWSQQEDADSTIAKLEILVEQGLPEEPYLGYILASVYEIKLEDAIAEKARLESEADDTEDLEEQIAEIDARIAAIVEKAAAGYRLALDTAGDDPAIQAKLDSLLGQDEPEEETE